MAEHPWATTSPGRARLSVWAVDEYGHEVKRYTVDAEIPREHWAEANRRMASPPTPDGQRHCLNRCCLPFYQWVRQETEKLYEVHRAEFAAMGMAMPATFDDGIPTHPHASQAPHWFDQ